MLTANSSLASYILLLLTIVLIFVLKREHERKSLPPGPRGIPMIGNVFDVPQERPWTTFWKLSRRYGDVICISILGQTTIVLNSAQSVSDLFEKRSSIYSTRPDVTVSISRTTGWIWSVVLKPYGDEWRLHRRLLSRFFQPNAVGQWHPTQTREAQRLLRCLLGDNIDLKHLIKLSLCRSLLSVSHGLPARRVGRSFVKLLSDLDAAGSEAYNHLVLIFPWLRSIPRWCPGGRWQRQVSYWRGLDRHVLGDPFEAAQEAMSQGDANPSMLNQLLDDVADVHGTTGVTEDIAKEISAVAFIAGADTTIATLTAFFCAMILYPEAQKRAQEELDAVVGQDRLPQLTDRKSMPYVNAVVKELLRWHNAAPLSLPHSVTKEDEYRGWRIPSGATVLMNIWGILHDPELWPDPDAFLPDRFMKDGKFNHDVFDPANIVFSAGRRVCPGKHFAEDSLFINIASVLHVYDIMPAMDEHGLPMPVEHKMITGLVVGVEPFQCSIRPRSDAAESLVRDSERQDCP
ncbi:CyP450 monooxygenase [Cubamyces lactineus]|nr:CyP450 monooxygenase [Cubamyces lactineus]